jgi:hypothetical protein
MGRIQKETITDYLNILSEHLCEGMHEKPVRIGNLWEEI